MKRKAAQPDPSSTRHSVESSPAPRNTGLLYEEATGKTVDFIRYAEQSSGWPAFEVRSQTGHSFSSSLFRRSSFEFVF